MRNFLSMFMALVVSVFAIGQVEADDAGLVLYYPCEIVRSLGYQAPWIEGHAEIGDAYGTPDASGYGNVGRSNPAWNGGMATVTAGYVGNALHLIGGYALSQSTFAEYPKYNANYVRAIDDASLNLSGGSSTIAFWMKPDAVIFDSNPISVHGIIGKRNLPLATLEGWHIHLLSEPGLSYFRIANGQSAGYKQKEFWQGSPLAPSVWTHAAFVLDATAGTMTLYLNGVAFASDSGWESLGDAVGEDLIIGTALEHSSHSRDYRGEMDEIRIYDYALTPAQVELLADDAALVAALGLQGANLQNQLNACLNPPCPSLAEACADIGAQVDGIVGGPGGYTNHGRYVSVVAQTAETLLASQYPGCSEEQLAEIHSCVVRARAKKN